MNLLIHILRQAIIFYLAYKLGGMTAQAMREMKPTCEHTFCHRYHLACHITLFIICMAALIFFGATSGRVIDFYFPL